jgi:hypothetical protein
MGLAHSPRIVTDGMVLCLDAGNSKSYPGSGTTWTDLSGNGNNGTLISGPTFNSDNGGSIVLDGSNDYVSHTTSDGDSLDLTTEGTWGCWFNGTSIAVGSISSSADYLISKNTNGGSLDQQFSIAISTTEFVVAFHETFSNDGRYNFSNGIWYNMVGSYDSSTIKAYVNGVQVFEQSAVGLNATHKANFALGRRADGGSGTFYFNGKIAQASVYNRALSAAEIQQNFNAHRGRFGI